MEYAIDVLVDAVVVANVHRVEHSQLAQHVLDQGLRVEQLIQGVGDAKGLELRGGGVAMGVLYRGVAVADKVVDSGAVLEIAELIAQQILVAPAGGEGVGVMLSTFADVC